jgi:DNA modification methylase
MEPTVQIIRGDCAQTLATIPAGTIDCCVTSPPYFGLRDYGIPPTLWGDGSQVAFGAEESPAAYVRHAVEICRLIKWTLRDEGTLWLNLGDSYSGSGKGGNPGSSEHVKQRSNVGSLSVRGRIQSAGLPDKNLIGIPWRVALALQEDGWFLRAACPWLKRNGMPDSTKGRPTTTVEMLFMLTKSSDAYYDAEAVKKKAIYAPENTHEPIPSKKGGEFSGKTGKRAFRAIKDRRLRRSGDWFFESWQGMLRDEAEEPLAFIVNTKGYRGAHFATFPPKLIEPCILASCPAGGTVLDPFGGSGTTSEVARSLGRNAVLCELNPDYIGIQQTRLGLEEVA